jgi:SsrA-binding protein
MAKKGGKKDEPQGGRQIQNRRARHDYEVIDSVEAGIALVGSEVKSIYLGRAHLTDAYCRVLNGEMFIMNLDIEPYEHSSHFQPDRRRDRKLLMHRKQIDTMERKSLEKGLSLVPMKLYFKNGRVKVEVALGRGRSTYDKREKIAKDETRREVQRAQAERH